MWTLFTLFINWANKIGSLFKQTMIETTQIHYTIQEECLLRKDWEKEEMFYWKNNNFLMSLWLNGLLLTLPPSCQLLWYQQLDIITLQLGMAKIHQFHSNHKLSQFDPELFSFILKLCWDLYFKILKTKPNIIKLKYFLEA